MWIFVYPGSWKSDKTEAFDFCEVSCTGGHENWIKLKLLILVKFHVPGVMKIKQNWSFWFLWSFMYPGSWKLDKIEVSDFCEVSCTRGHENWRKLKYLIFVNTLIFSNFHDPGYTKIHQNQKLKFCPIFMTPGTQKFTKIKSFRFV